MNYRDPSAHLLGPQASTTSNPQQWFIDWVRGGQESDAGVAVTYSTALTYAYVWSAVTMISGDIASLPLNVYSVDGEGDREVNTAHNAQWLLNEEPNDEMDALTFRETLTSHMLLWGNGYAAIIRDNAMRPVQLVPMMPDSVEPLRDDSGRLFYRNWPDSSRGRVGGEVIDILPRDVLHIKGFGWDGLQGHSVITLARNSWGLGLAQQKHGSTHFSEGGEPSIVLETEAKLGQQDAEMLLARWEARHRNKRAPALMSHGLSVKPFSMSNEDSQWLESRGFQRVEVAAWFKMPPHKLGDSSRTAYNSIESENRSYLNQTLKVPMRKWESESRRKLLAERVRRSRSMVVVHDTQDLLTADIETQTDVLVKLRAAEIVNRNEVRRKLGWSSTEGGDDFTNPNVRPGDRDANDTESTGEGLDARARDAQKTLIADRIERAVSIESKRAIQAAGRSDNFVAWVDKFYADDFQPLLTTTLDPVIHAYSTLPGVSCEVTATKVAEMHVSESKAALLNVAGYSDPDSLEQNVTQAVSDWPSRAVTMASQIVGG